MVQRRTLLLCLLASAGSVVAGADEPDKSRTMPPLGLRLNDPSWTHGSVAVEDLTPQFSFLLSHTVYVGDPNSLTQMQSGEFDRPLSVPSLGAQNPLRPTAADAVGRESALAAYYRDVMTLKGTQPTSGEEDYWLRFDLVSRTVGKAIHFSYSDRVSDTKFLFAWLREGASEDYSDQDQGWMFKAGKRGERLHFQQSDPDTGEELANLSIDRITFLERLRVAEADVLRVVAALKMQLGVDPWS